MKCKKCGLCCYNVSFLKDEYETAIKLRSDLRDKFINNQDVTFLIKGKIT